MKTLVAVYKDPHTAQRVIEALLETGFSGDDISLIVKDTHSSDTDEFSSGDGAGFGALVGALVGIGSALVPGIGPLIGSGPMGVAVTVGIGVAAGALTGGLSAGLLDLEMGEASAQERMLQAEGGTIVSVTSNEEWLEWAQKIMARHDPLKIEEREAKWYIGGWTASPVMESTSQHLIDGTADQHISGTFKRPASNPAIKRVKRVQIYDN